MMSLPTVPFGPHRISRLIIGGNPFSGFSHQSPERDEEMMDYYTVDRIKQTLLQCEEAGINTCLLRTDAHICRMLREYRNEGGRLQWIAQQDPAESLEDNIRRAIASGAVAYFIHGGIADGLYAEGKLSRIDELIGAVKANGLMAGVAGHAPEVHVAVYEAGIPADFHMVSFYNCGSLHAGEGERFEPADPPKAVETIQRIDKPCIAYKVLGAGRVPAGPGLRYAYENIKPTDAVVIGMFTKDNPRMVADNAALVTELLANT